MAALELTVWGHAGVRLERGGARLAVDPGSFTDPQIFDGVSAILITHAHGDHLDAEAVAAQLAHSPEMHVWAPEAAAVQLERAGAAPGQVEIVAAGASFTAAGFEVRVLGGAHAVIHPSLDPIENLAYLIDEEVLHPGDSFPDLPADAHVKVLALPVSAPWLKLGEAVDYAQSIRPSRAVPIHDAILSSEGVHVIDRVAGMLLGGIEYRRLARGEVMTV